MNELKEEMEKRLGCGIAEADDKSIYRVLLAITQEAAAKKQAPDTGRKLYYVSAEFLIGKLLGNNLINLGMYEEVKKLLEKNGKSLGKIEELENEPSLGNGGLGRLAACFLDSIATLGLNGDGVGLNYHFGLFHQDLKNHIQNVSPDRWITDPSWEVDRKTGYDIQMAGKTYHSHLYDIYVTGYEGRTNRLHLFDLDSVDDGIVHDGIDFDKTAIDKNLTLFLYPDDSDDDGRKLRVYQEYFLSANAAHLLIDEAKAKGADLAELDKFTVAQINDTHPTMLIPELIRQLTEEGLDFDKAVDVVSKICAYTNHTILAEALEKWPLSYLKEIVPQLVPIIEILDDRARRRTDDLSTAIIDSGDTVHMAHIDLHYGFSVNGVAKIHTHILKETELANFSRLYPDKFNNKTNGITFRRWLIECNPRLTALLNDKIGTGWHKDAQELEKLLAFADDEDVLKAMLQIKEQNKKDLADVIREKEGVELMSDGIFDIQVKRLHEYKRQQMNALYIIHKYLEIKAGKKPVRPLNFIFGAKAAPAYIIAQDIIHLLLLLQTIIDSDPDVSPYMRLVFVTNYNVTYAEKLIPAGEVSEQISLASKEASGTSNMKFMANGAVTLGTNDGANVEIRQLVGDDNLYSFGVDADTVIAHYAKADYRARDYYEKDPVIKESVDFITGPQTMAIGDPERLNRLKNDMINKDWFMALIDLKDYIRVKDQCFADYEDRTAWARKMLVNTAKSGAFSSDRTIRQYNEEIWKLN
ncbi:MAG: glycogen/starch/alpha-glucan family phosphorylase [Lachnospiraceae bacterium]|jgi:starch phosphorylase|nr:glycogen/starch/alpha-glucan family phosphorylase [Lachnospiraceae bacterium]MCH4030001.1 glycogen/starch/alpha-glucan family phosphorylase [Lachnospiraceae bacterium]MCH4070339.1 glycogen/starch/alpha-glucan family phosphorylase [Lachnospiraceae bacterium]MCH4107851.1 glycogen/starch/alpha-glucan family phosphorylase [Lachnospiraceae bacterium]MCI1331565.1 glycogen/starch/alpha-glucan family phosphorylase [Lachnospiraceae bacterium]